MAGYLKSFGNQPAAGSLNHREMIAELKQGKIEFRAYESVMTVYERQVVKQDLSARRDRYRDNIVDGLLREWDEALIGLQNAQAGIQKAYQAEAQRWDATKLTAELTTAQQLADLAIQRGRKALPGQPGLMALLENIYLDAQNSGDLHRLRATAEVLAGMGTEAGIVSGQAAVALRQLREPPDLASAKKVEFEALRALADLRKEMVEAGELIQEPVEDYQFGSGPLAQAARRLHATGNGVEVLPPDHPEVTRIYGPKPDIRKPDELGDIQS